MDEKVLVEQREVIRSIANAVSNVKKMGKAKHTIAILQNRLGILQGAWTQCQQLNARLQASASPAEKASRTYFTAEEFVGAQASYLDASDYLSEQLYLLASPIPAGDADGGSSTGNPGTAGVMSTRSQTLVQLPRIDLPKFDGDYAAWESFRDLFHCLIVQNETLSNAQRLHYLKSSLSGEPANLLKHVVITDANYQSAWDSLKGRYDNQRVIIHTHLHKLTSIPKVGPNSVQDLKRLRDTTDEALAALKNLKRSVQHWDDLLVFLITQRLDSDTLTQWEMKLGSSTSYPTYQELSDFIASRIRALESISLAIAPGGPSSSTKPARSNTRAHVGAKQNHAAKNECKPCVVCRAHHFLYQCTQFKEQNGDQRRQIARDNRYCFNCLREGHLPRACPSKYRCGVCQKRHHTLLHTDATPAQNDPAQVQIAATIAQTTTPVESVPSTNVTTHVAQQLSHQDSSHILLATAWVTIHASNGRALSVRALLDQGSESSFITESVAQTVRLPRERVHTTVSGIGGSEATVARSKATFTLSSAYDTKPLLTVTALILPRLTSYIPPRVVRGPEWPHLQGLRLADPFLDNPSPVGLIIGSDVYGCTLLDGLKRGPAGAPIAQNTIFGWILSGPIAPTADDSVPTTRVHHTVTHDDLNVTLQQFFAIESVATELPRTEDEQKCSEHFDATHTRLDDNRYQVRLPFKDPLPLEIGQSLSKADACLRHLERRLARDPELSHQYHSFLDEYEALGHMVQVRPTPSPPVPLPRVYIPHHPVVKESSSTTRLRVVFNASSPTSDGTSLNDHMYTGPKLQQNLTSILIQWRSHKYVYSADIAKMYRQIAVDPRDRQYQCIRWRRAPDEEICTFELSTVTYGTAAAPFLALRVLAQLSHDEGAALPLAKPVLDENFYVDDVLFGADSIDLAKLKRNELNKLMERGGFHLRKWAANHPDLLEGIPVPDRESSNAHSIQESESIKVLGLKWHTETDTFRFQATVPPLEKITKRTVLSVIARLFDPLGWLAPIIITAKILMQSLWLTPSEWDSELPTQLLERWTEYCNSLANIHKIVIPRWTNMSAECTYEIHGFADASTRAYAAVIYLCVRNESGFISSTLLIAKTKVAPVKTLSVPRLELCAATLLSELLENLQTMEMFRNIPSYGWTDSTIVIAWLAQHASTWRTFVANRIADIHRRHPNLQWGHVPSAENPADGASRGVPTDVLATNTLWWNGPHWLRADKAGWPQALSMPSILECELQTNVTSHVAGAKNIDWPPIDRISSWPRLLHVTAYCIKFIDKCQKTLQQGPPPLDYVARARIFLIRVVQRCVFVAELQALNNKEPIGKQSPIKGLYPSIDAHGVLRVGGRLSHSTLSYAERHPIILPHHRVSNLIVQQAHQRSLHGGVQLTLRVLRQNFWILRARTLVRAHINKCVPCVRQRAAMPQQLMANLPSTRVTPSRPFLHCGVDYAGPILARTTKGRGHQAQKAYISVFVCFATRAIHLELVSDYSSVSFIAALKRFASRRGIPAALYSDNGTTFQGADKELRLAFRGVMKDHTVRDYLASDGISWYFLPPASPHMGGLWEAGVKSVKHHLRRIVGAKTLTNEELGTLLCQIEACLNSRPISPMTNDPEDLTPLTPGHFLIGAPLLAVPEPSLLEINVNRLSRWQLVQQMVEQFWKRWATEYLHTLQQRYKWSETTSEIEPNDLVLLRNDALPPAKWHLARVMKCHPGADGHTRVVTIKTAQSEYKRPITQLCLLPVRKAEVA